MLPTEIMYNNKANREVYHDSWNNMNATVPAGSKA